LIVSNIFRLYPTRLRQKESGRKTVQNNCCGNNRHKDEVTVYPVTCHEGTRRE